MTSSPDRDRARFLLRHRPARPRPCRPSWTPSPAATRLGALALVSPQATVTVHPLGLGGRGPVCARAFVLGDMIRAFPDLLVTTGRIITTG